MQIERKNIADLKAATYNPRKDLKPGDTEFEKLKRSIEDFGYVEPIICNGRTGNVVGGHQRLKVMKYLGHTEVECVIVDLDEQKEKALNIALNKVSGSWDEDLLVALLRDLDESGFDLTMTGFDMAETAALFGSGSMENVKEDNFDEEEEVANISEAVTQSGDIWHLGKHRLLCGDSTNIADVEKVMDGDKADLMVTDPPYNVNYQGCIDAHKKSGHRSNKREKSDIANDNMSDEKFRAFLSAFYTAAFGVMKGGAAAYIFHSTKETVNFTETMKGAGFKVHKLLCG